MTTDNHLPDVAHVPMQWVGPLHLRWGEVDEQIEVPLATYESPLWPSTGRGARVSVHSGGIVATVVDERMSRSVAVQAPDAAIAARCCAELKQRFETLQVLAAETGRFVRLVDLHTQQVARLLFLRFEYTTGDAAGHNMVTKASDALLSWIVQEYDALEYVSISGNYCTDKKPSAVNGILGRGKYVVAELLIPQKICHRFLKTDAAKVADLNIKKNLVGTSLAGGLRSANAHFANMLLGFYLATGQDAANIIEGSQGYTWAEDRDGDLYFSVTLPNLILGTAGAGKDLPFVREVLARLGCAEDREPGENARRLAVICAATVLCGELSLMAAQTNPGELMQAHLSMERG